ncbi:MAG: RtcB family protein [Candidatus Cryptobacteroides sp.]
MNTTINGNALSLEGEYCKDCIIYTKDVEKEALETIGGILGNPLFREAKVRVMPDVHQGKDIVIGFTCPVTSCVSPKHVGIDIGCGIDLEFFDRPLEQKDYALFEHRLRKEVPSGMDVNKERQFEMKPFLKFLRQEFDSAVQSACGLVNHLGLTGERDLDDWLRSIGMDNGMFYKSIGSIGGGNHFMEYDEGDSRFAFTVHTGSRHLGMKVFNKWDRIARRNPDFPGYLFGEDLKGYLTDMVIAQAYAKFNRKVVLEKAARIMHKINGACIDGYVKSTHNYVDFRDMILRKGAIRSYAGELMVIPFNMRDGIAICEGKSNPEWNFSAPHGSGRRMSRAEARRSISLETYHSQMHGVYTTSVSPETLDEAPDAYKDTGSILESLGETCIIRSRMSPKINIKSQ